MGEAKRRQELALKPAAQALSEALGWVETPSGKFQMRWNDEAAVTAFGQMAFFIEFRNLTGLLDVGIVSCPLAYQSPHAPSRHDLRDTWLWSILAGPKR